MGFWESWIFDFRKVRKWDLGEMGFGESGILRKWDFGKVGFREYGILEKSDFGKLRFGGK